MRRLLLVSDTHGGTRTLKGIIANEPQCDSVIHLGDGSSDIFKVNIEERSLIAIKGNCDHDSRLNPEFCRKIEGLTVCGVHGDKYGVKYSLNSLEHKAVTESADIILYGHSHNQKDDSVDGVRFINPGHGRSGEYAVLTIEDGHSALEFKQYEKPGKEV